jgi:parallel beta-helix repeat protein
VNAAASGATINVQGLCVGATKISYKKNLTIQGVPPTPTGCPATALQPTDLISTLRGSGGSDVIKVTGSTNIVIRFLNIVDDETGVEIKRSQTSRLDCNCIARNFEDGVELHGGKLVEVTQNLIIHNGIGVNVHDGAQQQTIRANTIVFNSGDGILLDGTDVDQNTVTGNDVRGNARDGIALNGGDLNHVTANSVTGNGTTAAQDSGIELRNHADKNEVDANTITGNADGLVNVIRCLSGSGNTGSNVTAACQ